MFSEDGNAVSLYILLSMCNNLNAEIVSSTAAAPVVLQLRNSKVSAVSRGGAQRSTRHNILYVNIGYGNTVCIMILLSRHKTRRRPRVIFFFFNSLKILRIEV